MNLELINSIACGLIALWATWCVLKLLVWGAEGQLVAFHSCERPCDLTSINTCNY
ncbi:hypothetical protein [Pseudomonas sp. CFBP13528]|uniref:hypothetical protein n=1 Tax=Pseudomonas sp. CFBP13528 TaxID=2184006 RepID=UPI001375FE1C|nr:hypothetical protein [Pseudomonas sp. CFBP13528]